MPRCEGCGGIPFVECLDKRNDDTVRFTQGDLFLCPKCDQFRFGSSVITKKGKSNDKQSRKPQQCGPSSTKCSETRRLRSSVNSDRVSDVDVDDTQESHPSCYYCQHVVSNNDTQVQCSICCNIYHQQCLVHLARSLVFCLASFHSRVGSVRSASLTMWAYKLSWLK